MATSRYKDFRTVKGFVGDPRRLETFPAITKQSLSIIPHTVITYKETDRLDSLAEKFLGNGRYWWAICMMNNFNSPYDPRLTVGMTIKIPKNITDLINFMNKN